MNKNNSLLTLAIVAASPVNATFEQGNVVFYAWDTDSNDTYFVDLGAIDLTAGGGFGGTDAGLAAWLAQPEHALAQWSVMQTFNANTPVGGPPAPTQSYIDRGFVRSSFNGASTATNGSENENQRLLINDWIVDIASASGGASSFSVAGDSYAAANAERNNYGFSDSMSGTIGGNQLFYSQADPSDGAVLADQVVVTNISITFEPLCATNTGVIYINPISACEYLPLSATYNPVPIPAAAWLFGSGLVGLLVARRKS